MHYQTLFSYKADKRSPLHFKTLASAFAYCFYFGKMNEAQIAPSPNEGIPLVFSSIDDLVYDLYRSPQDKLFHYSCNSLHIMNDGVVIQSAELSGDLTREEALNYLVLKSPDIRFPVVAIIDSKSGRPEYELTLGDGKKFELSWKN